MIYQDAQGRRYIGIPTPYGMFYQPIPQTATARRFPAQPRGMGALSGDESGKVYVTWKAVAGSNFGMWDATAKQFSSLLAQRGFDVSTVTWDVSSYVPPLFNLIFRGYLPSGIDGAESLIADIAEQAGFQIVRSSIEFHAGGTPAPGGGSNPDDKPTDWTWLYVALGGLLVVELIRR